MQPRSMRGQSDGPVANLNGFFSFDVLLRFRRNSSTVTVIRSSAPEYGKHGKVLCDENKLETHERKKTVKSRASSILRGTVSSASRRCHQHITNQLRMKLNVRVPHSSRLQQGNHSRYHRKDDLKIHESMKFVSLTRRARNADNRGNRNREQRRTTGALHISQGETSESRQCARSDPKRALFE